MPPSRQVYCIFCTQTFFCSDAYTCSLCGKAGGLVDPNGPEAMAGLAAKKYEPTPIGQIIGDGLGDAVNRAILGWRLLKMTVGGAMLIGIGILLLGHPDLREDSRGLSSRDVLVSLGPVLAGVVLLGWACWTWRALAQQSKSGQGDDNK